MSDFLFLVLALTWGSRRALSEGVGEGALGRRGTQSGAGLGEWAGTALLSPVISLKRSSRAKRGKRGTGSQVPGVA